MQVGVDTQVALATSSAQADGLAKTAASLAAKSRGDSKAASGVPRQFSKLLATMLVKEMRKALPEGFFGEGAGSDIFDGWLDENIGNALAERDGLHLENMIAHSMRTKIEAGAESEQSGVTNHSVGSIGAKRP